MRSSYFAIAACLFLFPHAIAAPFVPKSDSEVLEHLPLRANDQLALQLKDLRAAAAKNPQSVNAAAALAEAYITAGRAEGDPRYFGYAQAALSAWWASPKPPLQVRLLRATLLQSTHRFDPAVKDLNEILRLVPDHPQALLTRATIEQVRGNFAEARRDCQALTELADAIVSAVCLHAVNSMSGQLQTSYQALQAAIAADADTRPAVANWAKTTLAEMAVRRGDAVAAEQYYRQVLGTGSPDAFLLSAYADFLLNQGRAQDVVTLLKDSTRADALLLRFALAQSQLKAAQLTNSVQALQARFAAARARGERVHLREEARFELELKRQPQEALRLAQENWTLQKEPADARVLLAAALAAGNRAAAQPVLDWLAANKVEDSTLADLIGKIAPHV